VKSDAAAGPEVRIRYLALFGAVEIVEVKAAPLASGAGPVFPY
jgi:hypothetical protein